MKSNMRLVLISVVLLMAAMIVAPVAAAIGDNPQDGQTIFANERGLDLSDLRYVETPGMQITSLVKYTDDRDPYGEETKSPIKTVTVGDDKKFNVLESDFKGNYGLYYAKTNTRPANVTAAHYVYVREPVVTLGVTLAGEDDRADSIDGKSISKFSEIAFKLTGSDVAGAFDRIEAAVNIEITTPGGAKTTYFGNQNLKNINISESEFWTDEIGKDLDLTDVDSGKYMAQAKWSNPDGFDDYADDSNSVSFTVTSKKIAIESTSDNVVRGNSFVVTITGDSKIPYWVYVKEASVSSNAYPEILKGQSNVEIVADNMDLKDDAQDVVKKEYPVDTAIALVTTRADGTRPVEFTTDEFTDDSTFTIKVIENEEKGKYDTVKVKVEKGAVTVTSSGTRSHYLGEEITLTGTNTDSDYVYLFIKGSNLKNNGASLIGGKNSEVKTAPDNETGFSTEEYGFIVEDVETDDTWEYKWNTADVNLDAATYTIYAVSQPKNRDDVTKAEYDTISVTLKEAFVTAETSSKTVAQGDSMYIRGTAEGSPDDGVRIWVLGRNYVGPDDGLPKTQSVEDDGSYEYEFDDTDDLSSGQYFVVVQHPMKNGFGLSIEEDGDSTAVMNDIDNKPIFYINGPLSLQGSNAAGALITALDSPNIDDTYVKLSFSIQEPLVTIDSIGEHAVGDTFTITGRTNLAVGDDLTIDITPSSFTATAKTQTTGIGGASGTVPVVAGDDENTWSFEVITTSFQPDDYNVKVESIEADTVINAGFSLVKATPTPVPTEPDVEPTETTAPVETETAVPTETTPGFGAILALIGLGAVAVLVLRKD